MAELIPNQPIVFEQDDLCLLEDSHLKILAQYGDITQFQMGLNPCLADNHIIQEGNFFTQVFWNVGVNWSIGSGQACHSDGLFGDLSQTIGAADGTLLRLTFTLDVGSVGATIRIGDYLEAFTDSGSYERWIVASNVTFFRISASGSAVVCISGLSIVTFNTAFETWVVDQSGATVATLVDGDFTDGFFTQSVNWETLALPDGCYTLQVFDPCPCSQGGIIALDFITGIFNWTIGANWTIVGGSAIYNGSTSSQCQLDHVICADVEYEVTYTLTGMGAGEEFRVRLGSSLGILRTTNGTFTENITANSTGLFFTGNSTAGVQAFEVKLMSIVITTKTATYVSNEIFLQEVLGCRTMALALCNDSDNLGFGFANTGFRPLMRIPASLRMGQPVDETLAYDYSTGRKAVYYGKVRMTKDLGFDGKPFMIRFAILFNKADHFYIEDVEYFVEDGEFPTIAQDEFSDLLGVTLQVSVKVQLVENKRISSASVGCLPGGNPIADDAGVGILDEEGRAITDG